MLEGSLDELEVFEDELGDELDEDGLEEDVLGETVVVVGGSVVVTVGAAYAPTRRVTVELTATSLPEPGVRLCTLPTSSWSVTGTLVTLYFRCASLILLCAAPASAPTRSLGTWVRPLLMLMVTVWPGS